MKPVIDRTEAPLLRATFHADLTEEEASAHFREIGEIGAELSRVAVVVDLSRARFFSAKMRRHGAEEMRRLYERIGRKVVGVAHVIPSLPVRGALTVIHWLAPPPFPSIVTETHGPAIAWARARLVEARA